MIRSGVPNPSESAVDKAITKQELAQYVLFYIVNVYLLE